MSTTTVTLGDITFSDFEIPETITFGGDQKLSTHELIGGVRVIDAMGRSDKPLSWSGRFRGSGAVGRARQVDALRIAGSAVTLSWGDFSYSVLIATFTADFQRSYELPYSITCTVVEDQSSPAQADDGEGVDDQMASDMSDADDYGDDIDDAPLSASLLGIGSALDAVPVLANAPQSALAAVLLPVQGAQARVTALIAGASGALTGDLGGFSGGADPDEAVAALSDQLTASAQLPNLYALGSILGRMATNLGAVGVDGRQVTVGGGNLYALAAQAYGDPSGWSTIANANQLVDPVLIGITTVRVPPAIDGSGGVLQP